MSERHRERAGRLKEQFSANVSHFALGLILEMSNYSQTSSGGWGWDGMGMGYLISSLEDHITGGQPDELPKKVMETAVA